jgi:hypothetical protein
MCLSDLKRKINSRFLVDLKQDSRAFNRFEAGSRTGEAISRRSEVSNNVVSDLIRLCIH